MESNSDNSKDISLANAKRLGYRTRWELELTIWCKLQTELNTQKGAGRK